MGGAGLSLKCGCGENVKMDTNVAVSSRCRIITLRNTSKSENQCSDTFQVPLDNTYLLAISIQPTTQIIGLAFSVEFH